jgi:hypothetical protein
MGRIGPCVSILVQHEQSQKIYYLAEKIAYKISKAGYGVTGGGRHYGRNKGTSWRWNFSGIEYCIAF